MKQYALAVLIAFDQLVNAFLRGKATETLSSRAWRMEVKGQPYWSWTRQFIDALALLFGQTNHCEKAFLNEHGWKNLNE